MEHNADFKTLWHAAALPGIILGAISTAYLLLAGAISGAESNLAFLTTIADIAKIAGCIMVMRAFLIRFKNDNPSSSRRDLVRLGAMTAFLSALVFAAANMAYYTWNPEVIGQAIDSVTVTLKGKIDANTAAMLDSLREDFPRFAFVSNLLYCFFYGWVLSAILSSRIAGSNPFESGSAAEDDDDDL